MSEDQDKEQKTEDPTHKRLEESRKKGQVPVSKEVANFFIILTLTLTVAAFGPSMMRSTRDLLLPFFAKPDQFIMDQSGISSMLQDVAGGALMILALPLAISIVAAIGSSFLQNGFLVSTEPITPKLEKISIQKGIARMMSKKAVIELLKGIAKISLVAIVCWTAFKSYLPQLKQLAGRDTFSLLLFLSTTASKLLIWVCGAMFFIALADVMYQRFDFIKNLRMTKQEIKDEYKQQEGDPVIKQRVRQLRMERARNRMMAEVPGADVVITNPTHYAVALKYEGGTMEAPRVVAKGMDFIALNIRKIAEENKVTIVENPPLARALYASVEIDREIPIEHYKAVAEIISYVYKTKGKVPTKRT